MAQMFIEGRFEDRITRIIAFSDWPQISSTEAFQVKMVRLAKLNQYHGLFRSVIVPIKLENSTALWMPEEEIDGMLKVDSPFKNFKVTMTSNIEESLVSLVKGQQNDLAPTTTLIICGGEEGGLMQQRLSSTHSLNTRLLTAQSKQTFGISRGGEVLICEWPTIKSDLARAVTFVMLTQVIVLDNVFPDYSLISTLALTERRVPVIFLQSYEPSSLKNQALNSLMWLQSMALCKQSDPLSSSSPSKLNAFFKNINQITRATALISNESALHFRVPETGALLLHPTSPPLLLGICSYLPNNDHLTGLRLSTMSVKRVDASGNEIDKDQPFFATRVKLPQCLAKSFVPEDSMVLIGPVNSSRYSSLTAAALETLRRLKLYNVIDENFLPVEALIGDTIRSKKRPENQLDEGTCKRRDKGADLNQEIDFTEENLVALADGSQDEEDELEQIKEIVPNSLNFTDNWKDCVQNLSQPCSVHNFYLHIFEFQTSLKSNNAGVVGKNLENLSIPVNSLIHLTDADYFNSRHRTFALLLPRGLRPLREIEIPMGPNFEITGRLQPRGAIKLTTEQMEILLEFQIFLSGVINVRSILPEGLQRSNRQVEEEEALEIPGEKKVAYLMAFMKKSKAPPIGSVLDVQDTIKRYHEFVNMKRNFSAIPTGMNVESLADEWHLDWELMSEAMNQGQYTTLENFVDKIEEKLKEEQDSPLNLPVAPIFDFGPDKPEFKVDLFRFALCRCILFAPHNGIFYQVKEWQANLTPSSPFDSRSFANAHTYAEYMSQRYGLITPDINRPGLAETRRIENFANIHKWVSSPGASGSSKSSRERRAQAREKEPALNSVIIPCLIKVLTIPYGILRMALLLPRVIFELERQLLAVQFYEDKCGISIGAAPPPFELMVEALTGPVVMVPYNYERLEILGDSILKLLKTMDMFVNSDDNCEEGQLTKIRQKSICNNYLYNKAIQLNLPLYASLTPFSPRTIPIPPDIKELMKGSRWIKFVDRWPFVTQLLDDGVYRRESIKALNGRSDRRSTIYHLFPDGQLIKTEQHTKNSTNHRFCSDGVTLPVLKRFGMIVSPKCLADIIEAVIAAFYLGPNGLSAAAAFLVHLQICTPSIVNLLKDAGEGKEGNVTNGKITVNPPISSSALPSYDNLQGQAPPTIPPPYPYPVVVSERKTSFDHPKQKEIEQILGYKFKDGRLVSRACSHRSVDSLNNYDRLEWLGDAALDWIVTRHYWEGFDDILWMTPSRITQARGAAVCNESFARVVVHLGLYKYLYISSSTLELEIDEFVKECCLKMRNSPKSRGKKLVMHTKAPKVLGDLLEALAGAVLVDSNFQVKMVEKVFLPILRRILLDTHADPYNLPDNPLHDFWHDVRVAGVASKVEFQYEELRKNIELVLLIDVRPELKGEAAAAAPVIGGEGGGEVMVICRVTIGDRIVSEGKSSTRFKARVQAARAAVLYIRKNGWRELVQDFTLPNQLAVT